MKVFRLEDKKGRGIYRRDVTEKILVDFGLAKCRPMPYADEFLNSSFRRYGIDVTEHLKYKFVFCYSSPQQLFNWFENKIDDLIWCCNKLDAFVSVYESPEVVRGRTQCAVSSTNKMLIEQFPIEEFVEKYFTSPKGQQQLPNKQL